MMRKTYTIFLIVFNLFFYWLIKYFFAKDKKQGRLDVKESWQQYTDSVLTKYFFNEINLDGKIDNEKFKVNLILSNHISTIDFMFLVLILNRYNINDYYFIFKESILKIPVIGSMLSDDIKLSRNWEKDQHLLKEQISNLNKGTIIIYPEGTRYDKIKHIKSKRFCYENKLPIFNYTLTPKAKGTFYLIELLKEQNKLGKIFDLTIILPKFINKDFYLGKLFNSEKLGKMYVKIKEVKNIKNCNNYEEFKKKLILLWLEKNFIFDKYIKFKNQI